MKKAMSRTIQRLNINVKGEGICPRCGGIGTFRYELTGPINIEDNNQKELIEIIYVFKCMVCGYEEQRKLLVPIEGLYYLRHLFRSDIRVFLEKIKLLSKNT